MTATKTFEEIFGFQPKKGSLLPIENAIIHAKLAEPAQAWFVCKAEFLKISDKYPADKPTAVISQAQQDLTTAQVRVEEAETARIACLEAIGMVNGAGYKFSKDMNSYVTK